MNVLISIEEPAKEQQRLKNLSKVFENRQNMDKIEQNILTLINKASGDELLSDEMLIDILTSSKLEANEMKEKLEKLEID